MALDGPDLVNRDPNRLNEHIQVAFEEVFGEPDGVRSIDCVWVSSYKCFECWKGLCYKLMTLLCGICIAIEWGCEFALLTFNHVWCWTPCMRDCAISTGCFAKFHRVILDCCCSPMCESCGSCLSRIKISRS